MKNRFEALDLALAAMVCLLMVCVGCNATGEPQPQPTPQPQPSPQPTPAPTPDPINTNGPDPVNTNGADPINTNGPIGTNGEPETPTQAQLLVGTWRHTAGEGLGDLESGFDLTYVRFNGDSTATVFYHDPNTGVNDCSTAIVIETSDRALIIDSKELDPKAYLFEVTGSDFLRLTDENLKHSDFVRESVPSQFDCRQVFEQERFELNFLIDGAAELSSDGDFLWITARINGYAHLPIDPELGAVGGARNFGLARATRFMQDGEFWYTIGVGADTVLERSAENATAPTDAFDLANTASEISINAAGLNPADSKILLHGKVTQGSGQYAFVTVDAQAEPDVIGDMIAFNVDLKSLAFDRGYVWGLQDNYLFLIDPVEFKAVSTFRIPDPTVYWTGVAKHGDDLWVVGRNDDDVTSVLMRISTGNVIFNPGSGSGGVFDPILNP